MKTSIDQDFTDQEMEQIKRFGQALGGAVTPFDEEVELYLARYEEARLRAAQNGGSTGADN
jgi:hypothetical protein